MVLWRNLLSVLCLLWFVLSPIAEAMPLQQKGMTITQSRSSYTTQEAANLAKTVTTNHYVDGQVDIPPLWLAIPFIALLLMIATGPLLYESFWHRHYPKVTVLLATLVLAYYFLVLHDWEKPLEALMDYVQFIALITALYVASGGVAITVNKQVTPFANLGLLFVGAIIANLIGTTGASMLLIRPYIRLNQSRVKAYHIIFFIFIVSNIGGALTPIGDPPLFLGFLNGVPFFWTLQHNLLPWLVALLLLGIVFYGLDVRNTSNIKQASIDSAKPVIHIVGKHNFIWFIIIIATVFIDPNLFNWVPSLRYGHHSFSFVRELILLGVAWFAFRYADRHVMKENAFSWAPLKEVVILFVGIFGTILPALQLVRVFASPETGGVLITHNTLYWGAGIFSSVLDNAPTYLNFSAASMAARGADIMAVEDVKMFAAGGVFPNSVLQLKAIAIASVFFGAMTYIGNGPNFMVKAIAEQLGIRMPPFFTYILRFSMPILLPVLLIVWLLFFAFS